ncbi:MAG: hypothetical protein JWM86_2374 [Thermoleophilia bacterium]|nr:hypothetical protein [Thermoleophilia bacterium]
MEAAADTDDPFRLGRFLAAQDAGGAYGRALEELRRGRKRSHWMWFVFPQLAGLGRSDTARLYAISGIEEARAYLVHPVLGQRLHECVQGLLVIDEPDPVAILGAVDAQKLRSSMTLFARSDPDAGEFAAVIERYFPEGMDPATDALLESDLGG